MFHDVNLGNKNKETPLLLAVRNQRLLSISRSLLYNSVMVPVLLLPVRVYGKICNKTSVNFIVISGILFPSLFCANWPLKSLKTFKNVKLTKLCYILHSGKQVRFAQKLYLLIKLLCESQADVNSGTKNGTTPLMEACSGALPVITSYQHSKIE